MCELFCYQGFSQQGEFPFISEVQKQSAATAGGGFSALPSIFAILLTASVAYCKHPQTGRNIPERSHAYSYKQTGTSSESLQTALVC